MANIKCRYGEWICACPEWENKERVCVRYYGEPDCFNLEKTKYQDENGHEHTRYMDVRCKYSKWVDTEFEGNYKSYEFISNEALKTHGRKIEVDLIIYLEIDGRVLIDNTEEGIKARKEAEKAKEKARLEEHKKFIKWANFPE